MNIVIIDDEILLTQKIEKKLLTHGYSVQKIHSYEDFLNFSFIATDIILLDISLQDGNGFEILQELKENPQTKNIGVIMMSGHAEVDYKIKGLDLGAQDYIVKPFIPEELIARIRAHTRKDSGNESIKNISAGDICFDIQSRIVLINGSEVNFSRKEKSILEYFIKQQNKLVTKSELAVRFWNEKKYEPNDNIINVTICNIRKKLGNSVQITTRNGEGYIFEIL